MASLIECFLKSSSTILQETAEIQKAQQLNSSALRFSTLLSFIEESQIISRGPLSPKGSLVF